MLTLSQKVPPACGNYHESFSVCSSYNHWRSKSAGDGTSGGKGRGVSLAKADYSRIQSRVDTGRKRANTDVVGG